MNALYVHLPFCRRRCTYCAFAISTDHRKQSEYTGALVREIGFRLKEGTRLDSIFYGGGTPSLMAPADLERIERAIRDRAVIDSDAEITLEANPEDISTVSMEVWKGIGVNRLSVGVQSFRDDELYQLGRGHGRQAALAALQIASVSGIRLSLDLIAGLPGQTLESFEESLTLAIGSGAGHVSLYLLDLEEGSALVSQVGRGKVKVPEDHLTAAMYLRTVEKLGVAGLAQYEISNFARPGEESRHNLKYWQRRSYLGVGLGAHSFDGVERSANSRELADYIARMEKGDDAIIFREHLTPAETREEEIFLGLRQAAGVEVALLEELCGEEARAWMSEGTTEGWLVEKKGRVAFTPAGFLLSNDFIARLF